MFTWANVILAALKVVHALTTWAREKNLIDAGADAAIGRAAQDTLKATAWGKAISDKIDAMDKAKLDDLTDDLGAADDLGNPR
jgi:hypothetical protein